MPTIRQITMYKDVGFDLTHKHCLDFENETQRDLYFEGLTDKTLFNDCNYNKADRTLNLECEWDVGLEFTYCTFLYNNKKMFYFVTGCRVVNDKVTGFELVLDVWQTFLFQFTISEGMITREHVDRWDAQGNVLWRKSVIEDKISNYENNSSNPIKGEPFYTDPNNEVGLFLSGIFLTYLKTNIKPFSESLPHSAYITIFLPVIKVEHLFAAGFNYITDEVTIGTGDHRIHIFTGKQALYGDIFSIINIDPKSVISISYQSYVPITVSNVHHIEYDGNKCNIIFDNQLVSPFSYFTNVNNIHEGSSELDVDYVYYDDFDVNQLSTGDVKKYEPMSWNEFYKPQNIGMTTPVKPVDGDNYSSTHEPELYKSPYIIRSFSDCDGSLLAELKDICWFDGSTEIFCSNMFDNQSVDLAVVLSSSTTQSISIGPVAFNSLCNKGMGFRFPGVGVDIPSDEWKSYTVSSRETDRQLLQSSIEQHGIISMLSSMIGMGGISGMAGSGKGSGLGFNLAQAGAGAGIGAIMGGANWFANNFYGWEQQEIKEKAIRNQPNNLLRSTTADGILKVFYGYQTYNELRCNDAVMDQAARRYHKYGYKVDMMGVPNVRTRKHFNFIQTSQIRIEGSLNQAIKDGIADILNNGVTIWHGEYITKDAKGKLVLDYSKENIERSLI